MDEEEITKAFDVQNGVIVVKLKANDIPEDLNPEEYVSFALQISRQRLGSNAIVADFPLSFFRLLVPHKVDNAVKESARIEDMRYKFF